MRKPFLSIEQQVELLESRGVIVDRETPGILMREGYYSVVNGYKAPFIDERATKEAGDDRYVAGTRFGDLYDLLCFDRRLRLLTFRYLISAEAAAKTAIAHCFAKAHGDPDDYLLQVSYCTREEYEDYGMDADEYTSELNGLIGILTRLKKGSSSKFVEHYRQDYGVVPIWVLCNDLTFGNMEHFFNHNKHPQNRDD